MGMRYIRLSIILWVAILRQLFQLPLMHPKKTIRVIQHPEEMIPQNEVYVHSGISATTLGNPWESVLPPHIKNIPRWIRSKTAGTGIG